jgi:hypothetical protein
MKKLIALLMVLLIAGAAFAQVPDGFNVGTWGRADFVPFQGVFTDDSDVDPVFYTGVGSGWGPAYTGLEFQFTAADGRIGGQAFITSGNGIGDNLNIWAKPFGSDILYIKVGKFRDGKFRGSGTDGNFQGFIGGFGDNGDRIFQRWAPDAGALFLSQPITGLSIYAQLSHPGNLTGIGPLLGGGQEAKDTYKSIQAGLAYDIANIGLARAQYVGGANALVDNGQWEIDPATYTGQAYPTSGTADVPGWKYVGVKDTAWKYSRIEAAFKLTAVENLTLDFGVKLPIPVNEEIAGVDTTYQQNFEANLYGKFAAGDFGVDLGLYSKFGGYISEEGQTDRSDLQPEFRAIVIPSFYLAGLDATVGADVGFKAEGEGSTYGVKDKKDGFTFGVGGWISRNLGKGSIKTGLAFQFPKNGSNGTQGNKSYLSWPIILEIGF